MVEKSKVTGSKSRRRIMLFALSTCIWCRKTRNLLDSLDVSYEYIYVDQISGREKAEVMKEVAAFNPGVTFPTVVIDGDVIIIGFKEEQIKEALG